LSAARRRQVHAQEIEQHARGLGLTRSQWQALAYLSRNENISQTGLADLSTSNRSRSAASSTAWSILSLSSACPTPRTTAFGVCA
jgi:hypothetical protein